MIAYFYHLVEFFFIYLPLSTAIVLILFTLISELYFSLIQIVELISNFERGTHHFCF
jgi:hypothetical protein